MTQRVTVDKVKRSSLYAALTVSIVFSAYDAYLVHRDLAPDDQLFRLHQTLISILVSTWVVWDARARGGQPPTFDHGWFVLATLPLYGPYYLISTRRWRGVALCAEMALLFWLPWLAEFAADRIR